MDSPAHPPESLFAGGMDSWRSRARLAHFLAMKGIDRDKEALELFRSVVEAEVDEEEVKPRRQARKARKEEAPVAEAPAAEEEAAPAEEEAPAAE